jgi:hypothetical protein
LEKAWESAFMRWPRVCGLGPGMAKDLSMALP